jgi:hypothetical protein
VVLLLTGLPLGSDTFTGLAYPTACSAVTSPTQATWISNPVPVSLVAQSVADVSVLLRPNGQSTVCVGFQPDDAGPDDAGCDSFLTGSPLPVLQFPATVQGTQSAPVSFTISNHSTVASGSLSYSLSGVNASDFAIVAPNPCTGPIPAGGDCTFQMTFTPSIASPEIATLTVSAAPGGTIPVALQGTVIASLRTLTVNVVNDPSCVQANAAGSSVTSLPAGIDCTAGNTTTTTCSASFDEGANVVLTATPTSASFAGFVGACNSASSPCGIVMSTDQTVTATFCGLIL